MNLVCVLKANHEPPLFVESEPNKTELHQCKPWLICVSPAAEAGIENGRICS